MNMTKEQLVEKMHEVRNSSINAINELVNTNMPGWKITRINPTSFSLGFDNGEYWNDGTPKTTDIEMYIGYEKHYDFKTRQYGPTYFQFKINPFTAGSFNVIDDDKTGNQHDNEVLSKYYSGVGHILTNQNFAKSLRSLLINFVDSYKVYTDELDEINEAERAEQAAKAKAEILKKQEENYNSIVSALNDNTYKYVVIRKGNGGNFIYRKQNVEITTVHGNYDDAYMAMRSLQRGYHSSSVKYQVIEKDKVTVLPFNTAA